MLALFLLVPVRADGPVPAETVDQKLKSIIVSVDFNHAKIEEALAALTVMSQQLDYTHKGVHFIIEPGIAPLTPPITLKLENVPLGETLRYVCELGRLRYKADNHLVSIEAMSRVGGPGDELVSRTFHVDPSFMEAISSAGVLPRQAP
jgi:hypothetical protein